MISGIQSQKHYLNMTNIKKKDIYIYIYIEFNEVKRIFLRQKKRDLVSVHKLLKF